MWHPPHRCWFTIISRNKSINYFCNALFGRVFCQYHTYNYLCVAELVAQSAWPGPFFSHSLIAHALRFVCGSWCALCSFRIVHLRNSSNWFHLHYNSFGFHLCVIYFVVYTPLCMSSAHNTMCASCEYIQCIYFHLFLISY